MLLHLVLFRPRSDLTNPEQAALTAAWQRAIAEIPSVRRAQIGERVRLGHEYEKLPGEDLPYLAAIEFDDAGALNAYLSHPVHDELARRLWASVEAIRVFDFTIGDVDHIQFAKGGAGL